MVGVKAASNSSASSSTSSVSSGVTSTVQRTRHIPISIASKKTTTPSPQLKRPSPKQTTVRVQMSEFSVDFGDAKPESPGTSKKSLSTEKKTPPTEKKLPVSGLRRPSSTSIGSNGSNGSGNKKPPSLDRSVNSAKKSVSGEKTTPERRPSTSSNGSDKKSVSDRSNQKVPSTKSTSSEKPTTSNQNGNKSKSTTPQRVVVADVHRAADENLHVEETNDEKSHEEEYRNSQTSDSAVETDLKDVKKDVKKDVIGTDVKSEEVKEVVQTNSANEKDAKSEDIEKENEEVKSEDVKSEDVQTNSNNEHIEEVKTPVVEKENEEVVQTSSTSEEVVKTPVVEKKQESLETNPFPFEMQAPKIIEQEVDQAIVDQEAEISVDVAERKEEEGQITTKILLDGENRAVAARDLEIEIRREIHTEVSPPVTPEPPRLIEEVKTKSQSEPKQQEDPIKPFIFKESKSETPQRYKDVSVRVESVEKESQPLSGVDEKIEVTVIEEVKFQDDKKDATEKEVNEINKKSETPMEEVNLNIEERKKSDADLAEVRVYRERYSEAPILPYPQAVSVQSQEKTPRIDLTNLRAKDETIKKRPLITPIEKKDGQSPASPKEDPRPRIISQELKEVDEEIERLKREPIRLNISSSIHSPPATSPPSPSQYENKQVEKQNGTQQNQYPSNLDINGLYKPHPLYPKQEATDTPLEQSTTKLTTTTLISTSVNENGNPDERLIISPSPSGRLSTGTGERSDNDFTPRTLSRIKHLNVIMEGGSEKDTGEVIHHHPIFMRDTSKYWYKPTISREEAIAMLKDKEPGTFVVRDSNSFPGAFGLALKVAQPPAGVQPGDGTELVRHFLIEPSAKGVKLKGCSNEPVFGTLAALIYQHSITPLALPAKLLLPDGDPATTPEHLNANQALLERGAACNVTYICSLDTESLTGPEAVRRAVLQGLQLLQQRALRAVPVHFKVSSQGITLTDNTRTLFFRRHYPVTTVTFAGIDPESRLFDNNHAQQLPPTYIRQAPMFGFVARKSPSSPDNSCHIFAELDPEQPASAVVRFITNVMLVYARAQQQQIHRAVAGV